MMKNFIKNINTKKKYDTFVNIQDMGHFAIIITFYIVLTIFLQRNSF